MTRTMKFISQDPDAYTISMRLWPRPEDDAMRERMNGILKDIKEFFDTVDVYDVNISSSGGGKFKIIMEAEVRK